MKNKVILITGALTGIGRATAIAFAREGAHVAVCGRHDDAGNALVTELRAVGVEAEYIRADVRLEDDVRGLRFIKSTPISSSKSCTCRLRAGCATRSCAAALVKFNASPTARKYRRCRSSIAAFHYA